MQQPPPPNGSRVKPPRNPLLSAAADEYPFTFSESSLLMPVTPATPAILQDEPAPPKIDSFIGQQQPPQPGSFPPPQQQNPSPAPAQPQQRQSYFTSILSSLPNLSLSAITGESSQPPQQSYGQPPPPQQSYGQPAPFQQSYGHPPLGQQTYGPPPLGQHSYGPNQSPNPYQYGGRPGDFNASAPPQQPAPPPAAPPSTLPPSGGSVGSYRLGNQRRLKYAPLPDLAQSAAQKLPYQTPSTFGPPSSQPGGPPPALFNPNIQPSPSQSPSVPGLPNTASSQESSIPHSFANSPGGPPPALFNPNIQPSPSQSPSIPGLPNTASREGSSVHNSYTNSPGGPPPALFNPNAQPNLSQSPSVLGLPNTASSQGSSVHNSFTNSPAPTPPTASYPTSYSFNLPGTAPSKPITSGYVSGTSPQAIPSRIPEPATPQNTPADAFSGFNAYRQQQQQTQQSSFPSSYGLNEPSKPTPVQPPTVLNPSHQNTDQSDHTFSPISAAQVTEKLENLIAEQSDDTLSIKSELSAEVANITANIPPTTKQPDSEELTEIDLSSSTDSYPAVAAEVKLEDNHLSEPLDLQQPLLYPQGQYQQQPEQQLQHQQQQEEYHQQLRQKQQEDKLKQDLFHQQQQQHQQQLEQQIQNQQIQQQQLIQQQQHQEQYHRQLQQEKQEEQYQKDLQQKQEEQYQQHQRPEQELHQQEEYQQQELYQQQQHQQQQYQQSEQEQQQQQPTLPIPSSTSFFVSPPANSQNVPTFYNTPFQQQPATDPFSFVQTNSEKDGLSSVDLSGPPIDSLRQGVNAESSETPVGSGGELGYASASNQNQQSIWGPNQTQESPTPQQQLFSQQPSQFKPAAENSAPTFFNPTQFSNTSQIYNPAASSNNYIPTPIGSSSLSGFTNSGFEIPAPTLENFNAVPEPTGSATLSPVQMSINPLTNSRSPSQETVPPSLQNLATGIPERPMQYRPVYHHWFYRREVETKTLWIPFSMHDSLNLEDVHNSNEISPETKVATDGGRYDVEILRRQRSPVYWSGPVTEVRRCSWFNKGPAESRYTPYEENVSVRLEEEFKQACTTNNWNRRVDLNNGEYVIFHSATVQVHYLQAGTPELGASWGNNSGSEDNAYLQGGTSRNRVVKRGMDEFNIDDGEPEKVDHLLFLVHGIGSVCDLKFRTVEEVVDEFRSISLQLVQSHYRNSSELGIVNRIEVLPISWHATLHSGIDKKLKAISLESIPKLRHFTNDTLLDILFYTSPIYCETIMQTVGSEMNRLYSLFNQRNPNFQGNVYLGGHSLGSLIVFDLLCHQKSIETEENGTETNGKASESKETSGEDGSEAIKPLAAPVLKRKLSKKVSYVMGTAGTGQPYIDYPQLAFNPRAFFALGSPIGMFVTVRGIDNLGEDFSLPTCPAFFNIFHPFDPVAYRVESLINQDAHKYRPMLIPHHKGRKRMHLELKETMARVGADLKQRLLESVRSTWNSVYQYAMFHKQDNQSLEQEIEKVVEEQMNSPRTDTLQAMSDDTGHEITIGKLNGGRRIDYVLQEAPFEYINEYLFALTSHVCYWESEDTMLMILKEIYGSMGIQTDARVPQQSLSIERVSTPSISANQSTVTSPTSNHGMDPTSPIGSGPVGPPPMTGFVKKS